MQPAERDIHIIKHIDQYCGQNRATIERLGESEETFLSDFVYQNAVALCIIQIGELVGNLSEEYRIEHKEIPWRQIRSVRNIVVHNYGSVDAETLWEIIQKDIPELKEYCTKELQ